jgi:hypothetical protein
VTVVDSRAVRRTTSTTRTPLLGAVEPGLSPSVIRTLVLAIVAAGVLIAVIADQPHSLALKLSFVVASLVGALLCRPSGARRLLRLLPLAWIGGLLLASAGTTIVAGNGPSLKAIALDAGSGLVLLAPWLWLGWGAALVVGFARGGLRRR